MAGEHYFYHILKPLVITIFFIQLYAQDGINIKLASKNKSEALEELSIR